MPANDLRKLEKVTVDACQAACEKEQQCSAYSYDKWYKWCYLKSSVTTVFLDPSSITAIRNGAGTPAKDGMQAIASRAEITIRVRRNRDAVGKAVAEKTAPSLDRCRNFCTEDSTCISFSFVQSGQQCRLYTSIDNIEVRQGAETGFKMQKP